MIVAEFFEFLGTNEIVLGVCSFLAIIGFIMTLIVTIKTTKIAKILKYNKVIKNGTQFNQISGSV